MEVVSAKDRIAPDGARYFGLDARLRNTQPSANFLKMHSSRRDRLQKLVEEVVAEQMMKLKEQGEKEAAALTMVTDLRVDVRSNSSKKVSLIFPAADAYNSTAATSAVQHTSENKITKHKQHSKQGKEKSISAGASFQRDRKEPRPPSQRGAVGKVIGKFLHSQSATELRAFINNAGIKAILLKYDTEMIFKDTKGHAHSDGGRWNEETFERVQLHFFLGRALLEVYDTLKEIPIASRKYGVAMYQWLMEKKDVNSLSRLAVAMMESADCSLPNDERKFVPYNSDVILALLRKVGSFERDETSDRGFWERSGLGCVIPVDESPLDIAPLNMQLPTPVSQPEDQFSDAN
jgi:hypothetical protein